MTAALTDPAALLRRDGAVVVRGVVPPDWIERMQAAVEAELAGASPTAAEYGRVAGRFYGDFFLWLRNPAFRDFAFASPLPALAASLMASRRVNLFYDQLFVKEPGSVERTPWHQDLPYWPVAGSQVVSIWVPFDRATPDNGVVTYIRGSHLWGRTFRPNAFSKANDGAFAASPYEPMPDIDADPERHLQISWSLDPGDVLVHLGLTVHGAPGNGTANARRRALAVRYTGDDARYTPRPGTFMDMEQVRAHVPAPGLEAGAPMGGPLFPRVWPDRSDGQGGADVLIGRW
jgi:ectoine hydroxylase-related dioxygenase (phytanoyl-CoA dioxygenase family)